MVFSVLISLRRRPHRAGRQAINTQIIPPVVRTQGIQMLGPGRHPGLIFFLPMAGQLLRDYGYSGAILFSVPFALVGAFVNMSAASFFEFDRRNAMAASMADHEWRVAKASGQGKMLVCRDVDVEYDGVQVLFGVDFDVEEGEIIALLGTNGAGKSTLLRAISGTQEASAGAIVFDGRDITHMPPHETAGRGVIHMPGGRGIFPGLTVRENIVLGNWMNTDDAETPAGPHRRGVRDLPDPPGAGRRDGGVAVGRRAADAVAGPGVPGQAPAADDRRAVARPGAGGRRPAARDRPGDPRPGHDDHRGRAVGQRRPDPGREGHLHGEGRDQVLRRHRRPAAPARHPPGRLREGHRRADRRHRFGAALRAGAPGAGAGRGPAGPRGRGARQALRRHHRRRRRELRPPGGRGARHHRPQRVGEDDDLRPDLAASRSPTPASSATRASTSPTCRPRSGPGASWSAASRTPACSRR